MDLQGFSSRDKSIINANPEASPYELKELGLSEKGFNRLLENVTEDVADDEVYHHTVTDEDLKNNPGEDLVVGETIGIPIAEIETPPDVKDELPANVVKVEVEHIGVNRPVQTNSEGQIVTPLSVSACIVENLKTGIRVRMSVNAAKTLSTKEYKIVDYVN